MTSQAERDAQALKENFDGLTESIRKSAEQSGKIRQTFLDLSSTANASGQAWTVISRLTSGTGFWKIQNRVRAISNFFQFQEKRLNEQVKREQEQIKLIKDQISEREKLAKAQEVVNKITENTASIQERQAFFQSDQLKYYESLFGRIDAVQKVTDKLKVAQENLEKVQGIRGENRARAMQKGLEDELGFLQKFFTTATGNKTLFAKFLTNQKLGNNMDLPNIKNTRAGFFRQMRDEEKALFANFVDMVGKNQSMLTDKKMVDQRVQSLENEIMEAKEKYADAEFEKENEMDRTLDDFQMERLKEDIKELMTEQRELLREQTEMEEQSTTLRKQIREERDKLDEKGIITKTSRKGEVELQGVENPITTAEYIMGLYQKTAVYKIYSGIMKSVKNIPFGAIFKSLGLFLKSFLFYGTIIIAVLFLLKESGILDSLMDFMGKVIFYFIQMIARFAEGFGLIAEFFGTLFAFLGALFFGSQEDTREAGRELLSAFGEKLLAGLLKIVIALGEFVVMGFFDGLFTFATSLGTYLIGIQGTLTRLLTVFGITAGAIKGATAGAAFGPLGMVLGGLLGAGLGGGGAKLFGEKVLGGMATGGLVGKSGTYLVGEQGPELVSLAQGQYVTPNNQLGGTVNITVNGRIGASETELRDIGNRLGDIINNRGNRVGNTRMFR